MTAQQLQKIEAQLQKRGYRKWTACRTSTESWTWIKPFDKEYDGEGSITAGYQVAFRVWDFTKYGATGQDAYGLDFWTSPFGTNMAFTSSYGPIVDFDTFETMAADFYTLTKKYTINNL